MRPHLGWIERTCETCGATFPFAVKRVREGTPGRFCTVRCRGVWMRDRKISDTPRDEMARLYREEGWTLPRLAEHYGLSLSTVGYHLTRAGVVRRPPTGANLLTPETLAKKDAGRLRGTRHPYYHHVPVEAIVADYLAGSSAGAIAGRYGCSTTLVFARLAAAGVVLRPAGFGRRQVAGDGHPVCSGWERLVDDWMSERGVEHSVEPAIPFAATRWRADFFARGHYVEVWGVYGGAAYDARRTAKEAHYRQHALPHSASRRLRSTAGTSRPWPSCSAESAAGGGEVVTARDAPLCPRAGAASRPPSPLPQRPPLAPPPGSGIRRPAARQAQVASAAGWPEASGGGGTNPRALRPAARP